MLGFVYIHIIIYVNNRMRICIMQPGQVSGLVEVPRVAAACQGPTRGAYIYIYIYNTYVRK